MSTFPYSLAIIDNIRQNYERFRFITANQIHKGLYYDKQQIYAVIETDEASLLDLQNIYDEWRTLAIPPAMITNKILPEFIKLPTRNPYEKINHFGFPLNIFEFHNLLDLNIPKKYHPFTADILWGDNTFTLTFATELEKNSKEEIQLICESIGYQGYKYIFKTNTDLNISSEKKLSTVKNPSQLNLIPSSNIQNQFHKSILEQYEEDEEFWLENKFSIFNGNQKLVINDFLPKPFLLNASKCFIDASVFIRQNLRVYLSIYEQVIIALPFNRTDDHDFYNMFKLKEHELTTLIQRGRLIFVIPQNLNRYPEKIIRTILEANSNAILFPRKLAASTILGIQNRTGAISTTFSSDAQYDFLHFCYTSNNIGLIDLANALAHQWSFNEFVIDTQGPISVNQIGLSNLAIEIYKRQGKDFSIEFNSASSGFEFAQGLNAHHFPFDSDSYSEVNACNILSGLYNGVHQKTNYLQESKLEILLKDILAINNDMNILEMDDVLSKNLIRKIPDILAKFTTLSEDEKEEKLYELRKDIRQIEKSNDRLQKLDFSGTAIPTIAGAIMAYNGIPEGGYLSLSSWILKALSIYLPSSTIENNPIYTKLQSLNYRVPNETIIIKSYRDSIKSL
ncbi:hypothetical protein [Wohlfahrtiimonas populi]|uniref:hypothetical protein n=1 Tax=Wohlfahrtiimonas populi TaxID=1940240 RepID=UPI00098D31D2|nr:hypothetical protein [Wohlfahrtiimonas populi]